MLGYIEATMLDLIAVENLPDRVAIAEVAQVASLAVVGHLGIHEKLGMSPRTI